MASWPKRAAVTRVPRNTAGMWTRWTAPPISPTASPCSTSRSASKKRARSSPGDRKSVVEGKNVDLGGRRIIKKKKKKKQIGAQSHMYYVTIALLLDVSLST